MFLNRENTTTFPQNEKICPTEEKFSCPCVRKFDLNLEPVSKLFSYKRTLLAKKTAFIHQKHSYSEVIFLNYDEFLKKGQ